MGLRDRASKVFDAFRRGDGRAAADAVGEVLGSAGVRLMDEVVTRLSGHPVSTTAAETASHEPVADPVADVEVAVEPPKVDLPPAQAEPAPAAKPTAEKPAPAKKPAAQEPAPAPQAASVQAPVPEKIRRASDLSPADTPSIRSARNRLVLLARDPTWAFAHWDLSTERLNQARSGLDAPKAKLRFYEVGTEVALVDADVAPENGRFYLRVPRPGIRYEVRLVFVGSDDTVCEVARSNAAEPPGQRATSKSEPARFVEMTRQTAVLDERDEITVPPPRVIADAPLMGAQRPAFVPRSAAWANVLAAVRSDRLAESAGAGVSLADIGIGSSEAWTMPDSRRRGAS